NGKLHITNAFATFEPGTFSTIQISGLSGNDRLEASVADVPTIIDGGEGNDVILGGARDDALAGGAGDDTIFGGGGSDTVRGGNGNDYLSGGPGADQLFGDGGNDQLFAVDAAVDQIDGGA